MSEVRAVIIIMVTVVAVIIIGGTISDYVKIQAEATMMKACVSSGGEWEPTGFLRRLPACKRIK